MPSSELAILILVIVIVVFASRLLRRKPSTPTPMMPPMPTVPEEVASSAVHPPVAQNIETDLARLASCARPRGIGDLTTVVQARIADQGPADWYFNFTDGSCVLVRGLADRASLTISADSQVWHDLAAKRIGFASARMRGSLRSEGDLGILMKLDDAFAGTPNESLLVGSNPSQLSIDEVAQNTPASLAVAEASQPMVTDSRGLVDAIRAVKDNPNLSAAERQVAMVEAIRHNLGPDAAVTFNRDDASAGKTFTSVRISTRSGATTPEVRQAIQEALRDLPPGATSEQKLAAIKAALGTMPHAAPFAALLDAHASGSHKGGMGGKVAELMIEGLLEGLLGGD